MLLERQQLPALAAIEHLVGLQAQTPNAPYLGLWSRLAGFYPAQLATLVADRQVVRLALMRSTVHSVTAADCLALRPLFQPVMVRGLLGNFGRQLEGLDLAEVVVAGRAMLEEKPLTWAELGAQLCQRWPGRDSLALANTVRCHLALIQVPPRGVWGKGGTAKHVPAETFLGKPLDPNPSVDNMVLRYLKAFGPSTVVDVQTWSGLNRLAEVLERLRSSLVTFTDAKGRELFDLPEAPRPDPGTQAPPRYLPVYDNLLLSHADRTRVIADDLRPRLLASAALAAGSVLVDGYVAATWRVASSGRTSMLSVTPLVPIPAREEAGLRTEGERLLGLIAPGDSGEVVINQA
jgi:hypothetical protein